MNGNEADGPDSHDVAGADAVALLPSDPHSEARPLQPQPNDVHRPADQL
jgi:hypothetical protein